MLSEEYFMNRPNRDRNPWKVDQNQYDKLLTIILWDHTASTLKSRVFHDAISLCIGALFTHFYVPLKGISYS
jgi:hypothetical protein